MRDPRIQPVAGDVLPSGRHTYYVIDARDGEVRYTQDHPPVPVDTVSLDEWIRSAAKDTVVTLGEQEVPGHG
ncbi:MAG: hypothetical protein GAK28_02414 [Luteibacter sp.]|uniref:hypothetical protein n=1 Tax=Luteibacter sp. TaxID=1886636 RepID=UPI0013839BAE|nr:hypothetical protein [Luteibacter sp.]KAF1006738.1 MAG: hypothetical protein GAK28_02414 [Luteibacter sp.]